MKAEIGSVYTDNKGDKMASFSNDKIFKIGIVLLLTFYFATGTFEALKYGIHKLNQLRKLYVATGCVIFPEATELEISLVEFLKKTAHNNKINLITNEKLCPTDADFIIVNTKSAQKQKVKNATTRKYLVQVDECFNCAKQNPYLYEYVFVHGRYFSSFKNKRNIIFINPRNKNNNNDVWNKIAAYTLLLPLIQHKVQISLMKNYGLGNQMFLYATAKAYALRFNKETYLSRENAIIRTIFPLPDKQPEQNEFIYANFKNAVGKELFSTNASQKCYNCFKDPSLMHITGYTQSYDNFEDYEDEIAKIFTFPPFQNPKNVALAQELAAQNSVSIHVRLGDYIRIKYPTLSHSYYYTNAINYIKKHVKNPKFYIFTNDPKNLNKYLKLDIPHTVVTWNTGKNSFRDMQLMSLCKHNIIANSTFSWWAAFLNANPDKIVISPDVWLSWDKSWIKGMRVPGWIEMKSGIKYIEGKMVYPQIGSQKNYSDTIQKGAIIR